LSKTIINYFFRNIISAYCYNTNYKNCKMFKNRIEGVQNYFGLSISIRALHVRARIHTHIHTHPG